MDTDELSNELYEAIFNTSEKFHHDLTLQFGVLASDCEDESDYISKAEKMIKSFKRNPNFAIDYIFFEQPPSKEKFLELLEKIMDNIEKVKTIPVKERHYDF